MCVCVGIKDKTGSEAHDTQSALLLKQGIWAEQIWAPDVAGKKNR